MRRRDLAVTAALVALVSALAAGPACSKESGDDCERAVRKMSRLKEKAAERRRKQRAEAPPADEFQREVAKCRELLQARRIGAKAHRVSLDCVLAASDDGALLDCMRRGRTSEAEVVLARIGERAVAQHQRNAAFPSGTVGPTPSEASCRGGMEGVVPDWSAPLWQTLGVDFIDPLQFQFTYTGTADGFVATAEGDLDCDGATITYTLTGKVVRGKPETTLERPMRVD